MAKGDGPILTNQQLADYEELGFLHSIPILSQDEVDYYRAQVEKTCQAIGNRVTRLNALHLFFRWAWELSSHPRLLDCLEQILGPNIVLKSTRVFYKYGRSASYVGWHQDGITEKLEDARAPAIWLGLTAATVENGCLRVVPRSHRYGLLQHDSSPDLEPLPGASKTTVESWFRAHGDELSGRITRVPTDLDSRFDLVMQPGEMSIHHPVILHGSNSNLSTEPRIGLSASYSTPELYNGRSAVVWVRGDGHRDYPHLEAIGEPPTATFDEEVAAYCASDRQTLFAAV
jgi:ectoine hydroxylase-related dioxygenase (phytanoyl-CoA dioxygenase family)